MVYENDRYMITNILRSYCSFLYSIRILCLTVNYSSLLYFVLISMSQNVELCKSRLPISLMSTQFCGCPIAASSLHSYMLADGVTRPSSKVLSVCMNAA